MAINLQSFLEKVFLYGSLVWLMVQARMKLGHAIVVSVVLLTLIELVQTQLNGRVAEITDPLLAIIMGGVLYALERSQNTSARTGHGPATAVGSDRRSTYRYSGTRDKRGNFVKSRRKSRTH